jgi:hypothetical protein
MPKIHEMLESKFLKKEDVGEGALMTISEVVQKNVAKQGADPEMKWCLLFEEEDKPLVLNSTNIQLCQKIFESDDTDYWLGKQIVLYTDPTVSFQGKVIGGIRVRKPKTKPVAVAAAPTRTPPVRRPAAAAAAVAVEPEAEEDPVPF